MFELSALIWNPDPDIFSLGGVTVRWYGLLWAIAIISGYQTMAWIIKKEQRTEVDIDKLLIILVIFIVIGARLYHVLYNPGYYLERPLEILKVWQGGLASHGGTLGILIGLWIYARRYRVSYLWLLDRMTLPAMSGAVFIRLGNFVNSEILGTVTDKPWGVVFGRVHDGGLVRHPVQLYEALAYLLIFLLLLSIYVRQKTRVRPGLMFAVLMITVFSSRYLLEYFKVQIAAYKLDLGISVGQLSSVPFILLGLVMLVVAVAGKHRSRADS